MLVTKFVGDNFEIWSTVSAVFVTNIYMASHMTEMDLIGYTEAFVKKQAFYILHFSDIL